jgi:hypothetical protein
MVWYCCQVLERIYPSMITSFVYCQGLLRYGVLFPQEYNLRNLRCLGFVEEEGAVLKSWNCHRRYKGSIHQGFHCWEEEQCCMGGWDAGLHLVDYL